MIKVQKADLPQRSISEVFPIFQAHLTSEHQLFIAVSTGADSMTLTCLTARRRNNQNFPLQNLHFLHCNHKIRPESEEESAFFASFFQWFDTQRFEKPDTVKTDENALRNRRYACFNDAITSKTKQPTDKVFLLTWHNLNDRIETTFLNVLRGCSLDGFLNMHVLSQQKSTTYLRPLLTTTKSQILEACQTLQIPYFTDSTNLDSRTSKRNRLRNEVLNTFQGTNFEQSFKHIYSTFEHWDNAHQTSPETRKESATHPARKASFALKTPIPTTATQLVQLRKKINLTHNLRTTQINERMHRLHTSSNGRKQLQNTFFFIASNSLIIIQTASPEIFRKKRLTSSKKITGLWPLVLEGVSVNITKQERIGATLRYPQSTDTFAGKTRNRRCLNQKIPMFWRNFIPLVEKEGRILHMFKEVITTKSS